MTSARRLPRFVIVLALLLLLDLYFASTASTRTKTKAGSGRISRLPALLRSKWRAHRLTGESFPICKKPA
jgi:hypothetical protein